MIPQDLVGKTISKISYEDVYQSRMTIEFTDGTQLLMTPGSTGMHNDRWSTVEYLILPQNQEKALNEINPKKH